MRRIGPLAAFWTLVIAIPFNALALAATAYITDNLTEIATAAGQWTRTVLNLHRDLLMESEIVGMLAGQIIILAILAITLFRSKEAPSEDKT